MPSDLSHLLGSLGGYLLGALHGGPGPTSDGEAADTVGGEDPLVRLQHLPRLGDERFMGAVVAVRTPGS